MSSASAPRRQPLEPGCMVAERYLVRRVLGEGGMGQVLEVEHAALGRPFALKILRLERWSDELVRRFNREARALARVSTPRVAQVTDFGVDAEVGPFYVMELLEGETLEDRLLRDQRVAPRDALAICAELCEALAEVHAAGIVHRDLKPSNVGLPRSGPVGVKLLDFGLAASMDQAFLSKITQSNQILGSIPYMAPEQFNGAEAAPSMDIYAVGVVLYEALTGRLPFLAPSTAALIHQILATPPPALSPDLPGHALLGMLLERLMAKEPEQRFASAAAAAHALREASAALESGKSHPPTRLGSDAVPETQPGRAQLPDTGAIGYLPTMAMPESAPIESGTRLAAAALGPAAMQVSPTLPSAPLFHPPAATWPLHLVLVGGLGIALAAAAGVAVVLVLRHFHDEPRVDAPAPLVIPAPPPPETARAAVVVPPEPTREVAPERVPQVVPQPVDAPLARSVEAASAEPRPRTPGTSRLPPRPPPYIAQPPPPPPPPPHGTGVGRPDPGGGIIRQW